MTIEIPDENSIVKWRYKDNEDWKSAEISDLITAYERPQGEWVNLIGIENLYKCSICGRTIGLTHYETLSDYPFCHCGADMRGGGKLR